MITYRFKPRVGTIRAAGRLAFDAFLFSITVGIWGAVLSLMILKWVMP